MKTITAYCWRNGVIGFAAKCPKGALRIARGDAERTQRVIIARARHAYDNETLLVPGVPEAPDEDTALHAATRFIDWVNGGSNG